MAWNLGLLGAAGSGGVAGDFELLETEILASNASSVSFTGLGSYTDYKHLQIRGVARSVRSASGDAFSIRLNSDSTVSYARHYLQGTGSSVISTFSTSDNEISNILALIANNGATGSFSGFVVDLLDFSSTAKNTTIRALSGQADSAENRIRLGSGLYNNTSAVTSISFFGNSADLSAGSRFSLYGIKAA